MIQADKSSATAPPLAPGRARAVELAPLPAPPPPTVAPPPATASDGASLTVTASPRPTPLVRRPWFWGVVGGAAVAVVVGVTLGVVLGAPKNPAVTLGTVAGN